MPEPITIKIGIQLVQYTAVEMLNRRLTGAEIEDVRDHIRASDYLDYAVSRAVERAINEYHPEEIE